MNLRVARHTQALEPLIQFYRLLGMKVLGAFKDHASYDGVFMGYENAGWHLEFTSSNEEPQHLPDEDDLLVLYAESAAEYHQLREQLAAQGIEEHEPKNPYWRQNGSLYKDPDGFGVMLAIKKTAAK